MLIKEIPEVERPRERLMKYGVSNLSNEELLAILIKTGSRGKSSRDLASEILSNIGDISKLKDINIHTFENIKGLGIVKRIDLVTLVELARRIYLKSSNEPKITYTKPDFIYQDNKYLFNGLKQEHFYVFYLDNKRNLIERKLLFMGTINQSIIHPREVFKNAYLCNASAIICMHNHPSGDVIPSKADIEITRTLKEIGQIQGISVLDHLVVSDDSYFSFFENNLME